MSWASCLQASANRTEATTAPLFSLPQSVARRTGARRSGWRSGGRPHPVARRTPSAIHFRYSSAAGSAAEKLLGCAQDCEELEDVRYPLALTDHGVSNQLHDPAASWPASLDVFRGFLGPQLSGGRAAMLFLESACCELDLAPPTKPEAGLAMQGQLVALDAQKDVVPLLQAPS